MISQPTSAHRPISIWLLSVAFLVFCMVVVGGITRLTESGLSMVRWEPISGIMPPMSEQEWQAEFTAYKAYPEYQKINRGMSLAEFKQIYFWEYIHRVLGRVIGLAFAVPLLYFWMKRAIPQGYGWRLTGLLALGGLQGFIGWWMVASGLVDRPDVAHERLATHLTTALIIFALLIWTALDLRLPKGKYYRAEGAGLSFVLLLLLYVQIIFGAFVAGLNAGYYFNTWPKMGEDWIAEGALRLSPLWVNLYDNWVLIQFIHRWLAVLVAGLAVYIGWHVWRALESRWGLALIAMVAVQFALGVFTILHGVPIVLGVAHQAGAALLLAATIVATHRLNRWQLSL